MNVAPLKIIETNVGSLDLVFAKVASSYNLANLKAVKCAWEPPTNKTSFYDPSLATS